MTIKFIDVSGNDISWEDEDVAGLKTINVFGSNNCAYFVIHQQGVEVEITEKCYQDFLNAGYEELE